MTSLYEYLETKNITYNILENETLIEVNDLSINDLDIIINNYDVIYKVNSFKTVRVRPSEYGEPERTYPFSIVEIKDDLPIVGIIDSGISDKTPLKPLIVNKNNTDYNLSHSSPLDDEEKHGTAVGCLVALGSSYIINSKSKNLVADAKLLSIKIIDDKKEFIPPSKVMDFIRKAHIEFNVKIFTLTVTIDATIEFNQIISHYGYLLDVLSYELDILLLISIGNNRKTYNLNTGEYAPYPDLFLNVESNLEPPADSMNNLTIGAIADNFVASARNNGMTPNRLFPAYYSKTYNIDPASLNKKFIRTNKKNRFKPDLLHHGGDQLSPTVKDINTFSGIPLLEPNILLNGPFWHTAGTSFSTPLVANLGAKIIKDYPQLNSQTLKAILINSASLYSWENRQIPSELETVKSIINYVHGHGIPNEHNCLCNSDRVTFIVEDNISSKSHLLIDLKLPDYLKSMDVNRKGAVLNVTATLAYKFIPLPNNHITYCPLHITFGFFKKTSTISNEYMNDIKIRKQITWAEDFYYRNDFLSNVQKMKFTLKSKEIISENGIIQIAVKSDIHKALNPNMPPYNLYNEKEHPFSLVVTIEEVKYKGETTQQLFSEFIKINNVINARNQVKIDQDLNLDI